MKRKKTEKKDLFDSLMESNYEIIGHCVFSITDTVSYLLKTVMDIVKDKKEIKIILLSKDKENLDLQTRG